MAEITEDERQRCWQVMFGGVAAVLAGAPGVSARSLPGGWMVTSEVESAAGNWFAIHSATALPDGTLPTILSHLQTHGRPATGWVTQAVIEAAEPVATGMPVTRGPLSPLMWCYGPPVAGGGRDFRGTVRRVTRVDDLETVYHLLGGAFGVPVDTVRDVDQGMLGETGVRVHVAEAGGPVSTCISWRSSVSCFIFAMATAPERQRQGAGRATLSHVMMEALQDGVERFILTSSAAGEPLYRSMGFETIETTERWTIIPDHRGLLAAPRA